MLSPGAKDINLRDERGACQAADCVLLPLEADDRLILITDYNSCLCDSDSMEKYAAFVIEAMQELAE